MERESPVALEPSLNLRGLVGCNVVQHDVDVEILRYGPVDEVQKLSELDGSVTPGDAQAAFDSFLGTSDPDCIANGDVCPPGGDGFVTPGDAQGIFNIFLGLPTPCG